MTIGEVKKQLSHYKDSTHCAFSLWLPDDVRHVHPHLTRKQANDVIDKVHSKHDASIGINWNVLQDYLP